MKKSGCQGVILRLLSLGIFLGLLGASESATATNYFSWNCESDVTSAGDVIDYHGAVRGNFSCHSGSGCMQFNFGPGHDGGTVGAEVKYNCFSFNKPIVGGPPIYYRWWMRITPGFDWGSGKMKASRTWANTYQGPSSYTGYLRSDGFGVHECDGGQGAAGGGVCKDKNGVIDTGDNRIVAPYDMTRMADGAWHEYVVMIKGNSTTSSSDAEIKVWIDGGPARNGTTVTTSYTGWRLHDNASHVLQETWCAWMMQPYGQLDTGTGGTLYVDDFSVDDTYNSLISPGVTPTSPGTVVLQ